MNQIEKVEQLRGKNITTEQERQWEWELRLGDIGRWNEQLNQFLESYTKGKEGASSTFVVTTVR